MNKQRRKEIGNLIGEAEKIQKDVAAATDKEAREALTGRIEDLKSSIESIRDEEQDYFDNMPEGLQGSEKGEVAASAISVLESAEEACDEAIGALEDEEDAPEDRLNQVDASLEDIISNLSDAQG